MRFVGSVAPLFASTSQTPPASPWCSVSQVCHARTSGTVNTGESAATRLSFAPTGCLPLGSSLQPSNGLQVHELTPVSASLEDAFMELTQDDMEYLQRSQRNGPR